MACLAQGLAKPQKGVTAIAPRIAACVGADLPPGDMAADIVLGPVGTQRCVGAVEHHQQRRLVGVQPRQQAVQGDEAGAAAGLAWYSLRSA